MSVSVHRFLNPASWPLTASLAAFCSTLILGAGVLSLPLQIASTGLLPLAGGVVSVWMLSRLLYARQADLFRPDGAVSASSGQDALGATVAAVGAGVSGRVLSLVGQAVYVLGACVGYAIIGAKALSGLVTVAAGSSALRWAAVGAALASAFFVRVLAARFALGRRLAALGFTWCSGLAAITFAGNHIGNQAVRLAPVVLFGCGVVVTGRVRGTSRSCGQGKLTAAHATSVAALGLQVVLMAVLGVLAVLSTPVIHRPVWLVKGWYSPSAVATTLGVVLFAFVGTGMVCVAGYPQMTDRRFRRRVVAGSMNLVIAVQMAWLVVAAVLLSTPAMAGLNSAGSNSALGLATLGRGGTHLAMLVVASLVTLIAVTNAASGFAAGLGTEGETLIRRHHTHGEPRWASRERIRTAVVVLSLGLAAVQLGTGRIAGSGVASLLAVAGIAGGGVLVFVLPILAEPAERLRPRRAKTALAVSVGLGVWGTAQALGGHNLAWTVAAAILAWTPMPAAFVAARRMISSARPLVSVAVGPTPAAPAGSPGDAGRSAGCSAAAPSSRPARQTV